MGRVGGYILKLAGGKKVRASNRRTLYRVAATYENLSKGIYPWEEIRVEENEGKKKDGGMRKSEIDEAVKRIEKENEKLGDADGGRKRKKKRKKRIEGEEEEEAERVGGGGGERNEVDDDNDDMDDNDDDDDEPISKKKLAPPPSAKKQKRKPA